MKANLERSWRQRLWSSIMRDLPATVTINTRTRSYVVRDNTLKIIYADDLNECDIDELIEEIAIELDPCKRMEFVDTFSYQAIKNAWNSGKKGYMLLSRMDTTEMKILRTDLIFAQGVKGLIFELRFAIFDIALLMVDEYYRSEVKELL